MTRQTFLSEKQKQNCKKALDKMPNEFSSRIFNKAIRLIGEPDTWTNRDQSFYFLKFHCTNIEGKKSWIKINKDENDLITTTSSILTNNLLDFNPKEKEEKTIINNIPIHSQNCLECGNEFDQLDIGREKKYCSTLCRSRSAWKRRVKKYKLDEINKIKNVKELTLDDISQAIKTLVDTGMYKIYIKTEEFKEII